MTVQVSAWLPGKELPRFTLQHLYSNHFLVIASLEPGYRPGSHVLASVSYQTGRLTVVPFEVKQYGKREKS